MKVEPTTKANALTARDYVELENLRWYLLRKGTDPEDPVLTALNIVLEPTDGKDEVL